MKKTIITYNWLKTSYQEAFEKVVLPRMEFLAKKWDVELIVSDKLNPEIKNQNLHQSSHLYHYNKLFILKDLIKKFDRVLCVDGDMVLSREMPNIFEMYPMNYFYAVLDACNGDEYCFHRNDEMIASQALLGTINWTYGYYNTGLMLLENQHSKIFEDCDYKVMFQFTDQTKINYYLRKYNFLHKNLSRQFNSMAINSIDAKESPLMINLVTPEILSKNCWVAHAAAISDDLRNDYIFKLDLLMP